MLSLWALAGLATVAAVGDARAADDETREVPPIVLPQARIDAVDVSGWPKVRVLATILDRRGAPAEVKAIRSLDVLDGKSRQAPPLVRFKNGQPLEGREDGKLWPASKAGVKHAASLIVVGHQHESLRMGSLGRRVKEALGTLLKRFGKTDRGQLLWYADRIKSWWGLKGRTSALSDVEQTRKVCGEARSEALSGGPITMGGGEAEPEPGTDLCGLRGDLKDVQAIVDAKAYEGYFPRLFNLGLPFFVPSRYPCKLPRDVLDQFGPLTPENLRRKKEERDAMAIKGEPLDYETSAMDEALRLLLRDGRDDEQKALLLISDGKDGYLKGDDLCRQTPPARCADLSGKDRDRCVGRELEDQVKRDQQAFKVHALHWIGVARAAGVRIFAVGVGALGERWELDRLRLLAERTGGTYREAAEEKDLAGAVAAMGAEVFEQVVVDFVHQAPETVSGELSMRLDLELEPTMFRGDPKLRTLAFTVPVPEVPGWKQLVRRKVEDTLVQAQELLGYRVYVWVGIGLLVFVGLITLLITFFVMRGIFRLIARLFRRGEG
ncbi:MAG: hypothetical protein RIT45_1105 [Pseudomonadota bacterium]